MTEAPATSDDTATELRELRARVEALEDRMPTGVQPGSPAFARSVTESREFADRLQAGWQKKAQEKARADYEHASQLLARLAGGGHLAGLDQTAKAWALLDHLDTAKLPSVPEAEWVASNPGVDSHDGCCSRCCTVSSPVHTHQLQRQGHADPVKLQLVEAALRG